MRPTSITSINKLPDPYRREFYKQLIPNELIERFQFGDDYIDGDGKNLLTINAEEGSNTVELSLKHQVDFRDPVLYGHLVDTLNDQIHILLYIMNDPDQPRYDVDKMPDGTPTMFGTFKRNIEAEKAAMESGLLPGQIRKGLGYATEAWRTFEMFVDNLGHDIFFAEPLYYHNAIIFERFGFKYQSGRKRMKAIHEGFSSGDWEEKLDGIDFRKKNAIKSIRLRSWAIHDGILGQAFTGVTMYKQLGKHAGLDSTQGTRW